MYTIHLLSSGIFGVLSIFGIIIAIAHVISYATEPEGVLAINNRNIFVISLFTSIIFFIIFSFSFKKCTNIRLKSISHITSDPILSTYYNARNEFDLSVDYKSDLIMPLENVDVYNAYEVNKKIEAVFNRFTNTQYYVSVLSYVPYLMTTNSYVLKKDKYYDQRIEPVIREEYNSYFLVTYRISVLHKDAPISYEQL